MFTIDNDYLNAWNTSIINTCRDNVYLSSCYAKSFAPMPDVNRSVRLLHKTNLLKIKSI